ncbi:MAG TPA: dephospho-CoA kinase [Porphyromonadaceae bacterium]|nr:dephospho-CoA kinase [Porphyromonadaceae bacterium]
MTKQTAHCPLTLITGGIGSGKSVVSRICRLRGYEVYDTDYEAKRIMDHDAKIRHAITSRWGSAAVFPDGSLNRKHIASVIFADDQERLWLNALVHSAVRKELEARISLRSQRMFVECAIPVTSHIVDYCDRVWLVDAPVEMRISRCMERDGGSAAQIEARMQSQQHEFEALPRDITDVIANDGSQPVCSRVAQLLAQCRQSE